MQKSLPSSSRATSLFTILFGLAAGCAFVILAFLSDLRIITPWYVVGCLIMGLFIGLFCRRMIRQALCLQLEYQIEAICHIAGDCMRDCRPNRGGDMASLQASHDLLLNRLETVMGNVSTIAEESLAKYRKLAETSRVVVDGLQNKAAADKKSALSASRINAFFTTLHKEIEELTKRSDERATIVLEMSATTDTIAENIKNHSDTVINTSASIEEMAANIKEISANIEALSTSTEQTSSSILQISSAINNVRDNTQKAVESSVNVRMLAQDGMRAMTATLKAMHEIELSNEESYSAISRLSVHSARVGEFVKVIQEVVEQTNLLSLNASIIAAQAGERGKAFAVVAEEVRSLARRTATSAAEIQELVKNIQKETAAVQRAIAQGKDRGKGGVKISAVTNDALARIEATSTEVAQMIQKIAAATVKQASGSRVISEEAEKNLERVRQVTKSMKEQERGTVMIVGALENMRDLSRRVTISTQEQTQGSHLYLQSVLEDNERMKRLCENAHKQLRMAEDLLSSFGESGAQMRDYMANTLLIEQEIMALAEDVERLRHEIGAPPPDPQAIAPEPISSEQDPGLIAPQVPES